MSGSGACGSAVRSTGATLGLVMSRKMAKFASMNAENTIKSLIPQSIIDDIPSEKKAHVAAKIVMFFKQQNPDLYEQLAALESLPKEMESDIIEKVRAAALEAHNHHMEMVKLHGEKR